MIKDIFVVFCPDGCMAYDDLYQCQKEKWVPIAVIKQDGNTIVPCFRDEGTARKFGKRNYPKDWLTGIIALTLNEVKWMMDKGWKLEIFSFPRIVKDIEGFGYEVLEFQSKPELLRR